MKRHSSLIPLSHDHQQGLFLSQVIKRGRKTQPQGIPKDLTQKLQFTKGYFDRILFPHFTLEEEVLIPAVRGIRDDIDKLIEEITAEHEQMKNHVNDLLKADDPEEKLDELGYLLESHIRKEERELFEKIQEVLSEESLLDLGQKLEA